MKVQKPKLLQELPEVCDLQDLLQDARQNETEIEEMHIKGEYLVGEDITGVRFSNILFENVRLTDCIFQKCTFIDVLFKNCDLSNCDMSQSYFNRCEFVTDKALGAKFSKSIMKDVSIAESNFEYVNMTDVSIQVAELANSNFNNASLAECKLKNLMCDKVDFVNANFFHTPLKGLDFTKSTITGIVVSDTMSELKGVIIDLYQAAELARMLGVVIK
ncbi:uncharacterized protein YjbI with pentapeptide repeats [Lachnotalea glycerini]|uniref:Pentapeptide repeat-containing protein n=1 Tax=Lachnotalea glycerini TaxID=1763509 RepID=A0A255IBR6_9FIRM|nr:pentapeptide repeat-containing protein [Lachnotalea glycerini]PXV91751.1 uncharacterized protein YjbI with pentapeptide repeats [Lachnotalea glycerini]RDY29829.1 pentapeptide repeat-containing protein [Lachnotalea glycerini]